jgi:hypothetical protein
MITSPADHHGMPHAMITAGAAPQQSGQNEIQMEILQELLKLKSGIRNIRAANSEE